MYHGGLALQSVPVSFAGGEWPGRAGVICTVVEVNTTCPWLTVPSALTGAAQLCAFPTVYIS
jgi:hypothetical protein